MTAEALVKRVAALKESHANKVGELKVVEAELKRLGVDPQNVKAEIARMMEKEQKLRAELDRLITEAKELLGEE